MNKLSMKTITGLLIAAGAATAVGYTLAVKNNVFKNIYDNAIFPLNWKDTTITDNTFTDIGLKNKKSYSSGAHAISGGGIVGMNITNNTFTNVKRNIIYFCIQQNVGPGSEYDKVKVMLTKEETEAMLNNKVVNCGDDMNDIFAGYDPGRQFPFKGKCGGC